MLVQVLVMNRRTTRELAHRVADGVEVVLVWPVGERRVLVRVTDWRSEDAFELSVDGDKALDAFHHPYAYATGSRNSPSEALGSRA
jgi:hypothetical protein